MCLKHLIFSRVMSTAVAFVLVSPMVAKAETYNIKSCKVSFQTTGSPVKVVINGHSNKPCTGSVNIENGSVKAGEFKMDLSDIDTGIPLRNRHLRENYLMVEKNPVATLKLASAFNLADQLAGKVKGTSPYAGTLDLKGKVAPVKEAVYSISGGGKKVQAKLTVELSDHGIEYPSFMGVKIVDQVHLNVDIEL